MLYLSNKNEVEKSMLLETHAYLAASSVHRVTDKALGKMNIMNYRGAIDRKEAVNNVHTRKMEDLAIRGNLASAETMPKCVADRK